jgi:hypothetical protein
MRWVRHVTRMGEMSDAYILVGEPQRKRLFGRRVCWVSDETDVTGVECEYMKWSRVAERRVKWRNFVNTEMEASVP